MSDPGAKTSIFNLFLTDTKTGERRKVDSVPVWDPEGDDATEFLWTEGNYGCDCNRSLFFRRSAGEPDIERPCGAERFILTVQTSDGLVVYDEAESEESDDVTGG